MEQTNISKRSVSFGLALAVACVVNALIVVAKEKNSSVMQGMKRIAGHHWTTHTLIVLAVFGTFAWIFGRANDGRGIAITGNRFIFTLVSAVGLASLIIIGFYLIAD